jgi:hypothetical protein
MSRDVHSYTHWLRPRNPPPPPTFGLVYEGAIGKQSLCNPVVHGKLKNLKADLIDVEPVSPAHEEPRILHHLVRPSPFQTMRTLAYKKYCTCLFLEHRYRYCTTACTWTEVCG